MARLSGESSRKKLAEINSQVNDLEKKADKLKASITAEMEAREVDEIKAGNFLARWKLITSTRFDSKAFKGAYSALYEQYTKSYRNTQIHAHSSMGEALTYRTGQSDYVRAPNITAGAGWEYSTLSRSENQ